MVVLHRQRSCKPNDCYPKCSDILIKETAFFFVSVGKVTKFDKVVKREICQITAKGTRVFSVIDGDASSAENSYLFAITEKVSSSHEC